MKRSDLSLSGGRRTLITLSSINSDSVPDDPTSPPNARCRQVCGTGSTHLREARCVASAYYGACVVCWCATRAPTSSWTGHASDDPINVCGDNGARHSGQRKAARQDDESAAARPLRYWHCWHPGRPHRTGGCQVPVSRVWVHTP